MDRRTGGEAALANISRTYIDYFFRGTKMDLEHNRIDVDIGGPEEVACTYRRVESIVIRRPKARSTRYSMSCFRIVTRGNFKPPLWCLICMEIRG